MKNAITKAIEGGWSDTLYRVDTGNTEVWTHHSSLLLDPLFWQALGKNLGWVTDNEDYFLKETIAGGLISRTYGIWTWRNEWHNFIDHLASGNDPESFFKDLLT